MLSHCLGHTALLARRCRALNFCNPQLSPEKKNIAKGISVEASVGPQCTCWTNELLLNLVFAQCHVQAVFFVHANHFVMTLELDKNGIFYRVISTRVAGRHGQNVMPWHTTGSPGTGTRQEAKKTRAIDQFKK